MPWFFIRQPCTIKCMAKPSPTHARDPALTGLGDVIRASRATVGLSQEALAIDAGSDRSYVGGIERGEHNLKRSSELFVRHQVWLNHCQCIAVASSLIAFIWSTVSLFGIKEPAVFGI